MAKRLTGKLCWIELFPFNSFDGVLHNFWAHLPVVER